MKRLLIPRTSSERRFTLRTDLFYNRCTTSNASGAEALLKVIGCHEFEAWTRTAQNTAVYQVTLQSACLPLGVLARLDQVEATPPRVATLRGP